MAPDLEKRFERIYELMCGFVDSEETDDITNEFDGECGKLYEQAYNARVTVTRILDETNCGENRDVLAIINAYERIQKLLCRKAFEYGVREGRGGDS